MSKIIKVLIVDDSAVIRRLLSEILNSDPKIEVIDTASDPYEAREKIKQLNPDVITLDIEMPKMDGLTFLDKLMRLRPMPVIMISTLTEKGAEQTMRALELGAVDFVPKPKVNVHAELNEYAIEITSKVKSASNARFSAPVRNATASRITSANNTVKNINVPPLLNCQTVFDVVGIGASTGGTEAILNVLMQIPTDFPGIVISQHIPKQFSAAFAKRVNSRCAIEVVQARDGEPIKPGHAYIAPGEKHLEVFKDNQNYVCKVYLGEPVNRHCPSVDVLFWSIANMAGPNAIAVMLTGMGKDGAQGMLDIRSMGGKTIAQDEASSVVWGMPGSAVKLGAVESVVTLNKISNEMIGLCKTNGKVNLSKCAN